MYSCMNMYMVKATTLYEWWLFCAFFLSEELKSYLKNKMNWIYLDKNKNNWYHV